MDIQIPDLNLDNNCSKTYETEPSYIKLNLSVTHRKTIFIYNSDCCTIEIYNDFTFSTIFFKDCISEVQQNTM